MERVTKEAGDEVDEGKKRANGWKARIANAGGRVWVGFNTLYAMPPDALPFFDVPLNLSHAGRVARRILLLLPPSVGGEGAGAGALAEELDALLDPCRDDEDNPPPAEAERVREKAAALARRLVDAIEREGLGHDRLGQCVRNLFECLGLGREGAAISLRAGEDPRSLQRPV